MVALLLAALLAGPVCQVRDDRLNEISGLVATRTGYVAVNDGSDDPDRRRIFFLDKRCAVVRSVAYPSRPRDTEDLAAARDGTLWVGDIGDNGSSRSTIAYWRLPPGSKKPQLFRLAYPDGAHDAEALLLPAGGPPVVVTKTVGAAGVYVPAGAPRAGETTPLRRAGTVRLPLTGTSNPFGLPGRLVITGGAVSPDGHRVTLRTYADAFEFDAPGGDVVRAVTEGTPRVIPLPDEPQGESVAYSADGSALLTVSEAGGPLLRYPVRAAPAPSSAQPAPSSAAPSSAAPSSGAPVAPAAAPAARRERIPVGAVAVILVAAAVTLGVVLARWRRR